MASTRETILAALAALFPGALRNAELPVAVPSEGLLIIFDGDPGEPEVTLSPLTYHYEHVAEIDVIMQSATGRDAALDALLGTIGAAIEADRTLGGLCDWAEPSAPAMTNLPIEGASSVKAAVVRVTLIYSTTDPLN